MPVAIPVEFTGWTDVLDEDDKQYLKIERSILAYFAACPNAADTLDGIVKWWLTEQDVSYPKASVEKVLEGLVDKGSVIKKLNQSGETIYASNKYMH